MHLLGHELYVATIPKDAVSDVTHSLLRLLLRLFNGESRRLALCREIVAVNVLISIVTCIFACIIVLFLHVYIHVYTCTCIFRLSSAGITSSASLTLAQTTA